MGRLDYCVENAAAAPDKTSHWILLAMTTATGEIMGYLDTDIREMWCYLKEVDYYQLVIIIIGVIVGVIDMSQSCT
jgi:hypothetical protein